jgi:hypothetical protein
VWRAFAWFSLAVITWLSLTPEPPSMPTYFGWDKGQHFAAYAVLTYWFGMSYGRVWPWAIFLLGWGLLMEVIQGVGGLRTMDPFDMVANSLGVAGGLALLWTRCRLLLVWLESRVIPRWGYDA